MRSLFVIFILVVLLCWGCCGNGYHPLEFQDMKILDPPLCVGDDSIKLPDTTSSDFIPSELFPELIYEEPPEYPPECKERKVGARILVMIYVDSNGNVPRACSMRCSNPGLGFEDAAVNAAMKHKYKPILIGEEPIGRWIDYTIDFIPGK